MIFALLVLFCLFIFLNYLYKRTNYFSHLFWQVDKFKTELDSNIELAVFGSGPAFYDIHVDSLHYKNFNFATAPQSLMTMRTMLYKYSKYLSKGCIVVVVVCPLSFAVNTAYKEKNYYDKLYFFMEPDEIEEYSKIKKFTHITLPLLAYPWNVVRILKDSRYSAEEEYNLAECLYDKEEILLEAERGYQSWIKHAKLNNLKAASQSNNIEQQRAFEQKIETLHDILSFCIGHGYRPVIVIPPMSKHIENKVGHEFKKAFVDDNIAQANEFNVPVLDYFRDSRFKNDELFLSNMFFNSKGRSWFSKTLLEDIEKRLNGHKKEGEELYE